jgi:hypothetical protein
MPKTLFDFSEMVVKCIHTEDFTNALKVKEIKVTFANLLITVHDYGKHSFSELAATEQHCHEVKDDYMKARIGKLIGYKTKKIENLKRKSVWQIPIGKEPRLFGIVKKVKYPDISHIFQVLLFDPNHKTYRKSSKNVLATLTDAVCLFNESDEC